MNHKLICLICVLPLLFGCEKPVEGLVLPPPVLHTGTETGTGTGSGNGENPGNSSGNNNDDQGTGNNNSGNNSDNPGNGGGSGTPDLPAIGGKIIVGYATYWDKRMPDPRYLTHINYAFALIKNDFETLDIKTPSRLTQIVALKDGNPGLKVALSIGGWGAGNFSEMAADPAHRKNFCDNCLAAVKKYKLDGIDLDWEYPTSSSAGISSSPDDTRNFTLLVKELRETLGNDLLLTMASSSSARYVDFESTVPYFNFINLMTYDMGNPPQHNAGLYKSSMTYRSCDESVELHRKAGVPYEKMTLGIPFYGHGNGTDFSRDQLDYGEISWDASKYTRRWDSQACVPYLADASGSMVLSYDDAESVSLKAGYVKQKGLLGAMYWNIEADDNSRTLSSAVAGVLKEGFAPENAVLVTNPYVEAFLEQVTYPERDYSMSYITDYPGGGPGEADIPPTVRISWTNSSSASGALTLELRDGGWTRTWSLSSGATYLDVTNLVPNTVYTYTVTDSRHNVAAKGTLATRGMLHQIYFTSNVRNARDIGGRTTLDGKKVRYRMLYRGGAVSSSKMDSEGRKEALAQGILAELDLREAEDVPSKSYFGSDIAFCAPGFDHGYRSMLRDRADGVKQAFEFVVNCLRAGKPVYFHCAAGRDRTGTMALILEGLLGMSESDMSKDFELTYFSPADWSMYQGTYQHKRTTDGSYKAAVEYIWNEGSGSDSFARRTEKYLLRIGVAQKDIDDYRALMLE